MTDALQLWWPANLWEEFEQAVSADEVESLVEVFVLLLELAKGEDHVYS